MTHIARIERIEVERLREWKARPALTEKQEEILRGIELKVFGECNERERSE